MAAGGGLCFGGLSVLVFGKSPPEWVFFSTLLFRFPAVPPFCVFQWRAGGVAELGMFPKWPAF
jgi:hypothetical protein